MATGWNVMDALNNKTKAAAEDNKTKARFRTKDIAIKQMYSNDKNFYSIPDIEQLAQDILAVGLLENLTVVHDPCDRGEYRIIAGERRWRALTLLVENGYEEFSVASCQIKTPAEEHEEMIQLIIANTYRNKTVADILEEQKTLEETLKYMKENGLTLHGYKLDSGRLRDVIANIEVATGGLGKKDFPRRTVISTQGDIRDGPLDELLETCLQILKGEIPDNGKLPFICWLDDPEEVKDEEKWQKANPSLRNFPTLLTEMRMEYEEYKLDPVNHTSFMTKRMNRPPGETQYCVTDWKNLEKATRSLPDLRNHSCVAGIDYSKTNDFVAAGLLFKVGDKRYWMHHTWVCKKSRDLPRIKYPLKEAEEEGVLTMVDDVEIDPEYVTDWLLEKSKLYKIESVVMDNFRQTWLREALGKIGFSDEKKNLKLIRPSDEMKVAPVIGYMFARGLIAWGTSKIMRWYTWNSKAVTDKKGNVTYEKIEPRSRKTDGFKAFVAAVTDEERIKQRRIIKNRIGTVC